MICIFFLQIVFPKKNETDRKDFEMHQLPFNPFTLVNQILWSFICTLPVNAILGSAWYQKLERKNSNGQIHCDSDL